MKLPPSAPPAATPTPAELQAQIRQISKGLQLSRASTMALMRLQLAIRSGDRQQAMEAMDRLNTLDEELERVITHLPAATNADPEWQAIAKHLDDQKLTLAFEKLALASGIVGPDLVSIENAWSPSPDGLGQTAGPDELWEPSDLPPDMPDLSALRPAAEELEPHEPLGISPRVWGFVVTLLVTAAIAGGVWVSM
ncbi:MAG TPA: hypothetical protein VLZ53_11120 [Devosia sp.]|nr:hypothetical protein [Devosia sp.]